MTTEGILNGKTAIVTGAGAGIGREIALLFGREKANVIVADRSRETGEDTSSQIAAEGVRRASYRET
jgi:3-oxoacyl-[acyl-carrier protein] reductase